MLIKHYFHVSLFIMLVLAFESEEEFHLNVTIQMRATKLRSTFFYVVLFIMLHEVLLTLKSVIESYYK